MAKTRRVPVGKKSRPAPPPREPERAALAPVECDCPRLEREDWHDVESDWSDVQFVRTSIGAVMGVPWRFPRVRGRLEAMAREMGAAVPEDAMLLLGPGRFRRKVLLEVEGAEPGTRHLYQPGGIAYSRLLPAPWGQMGRALQETVAKARERYGRDPDRTWVWYLTCPVCSEEREFETLFVAHYDEPPGDR